MLPYNELPIILVSAVDTVTAASFISELIDDEVKDIEVEGEETLDRVWRLRNKYYEAEVRVCGWGDGEGAPLTRVDAHIVLVGGSEGEREASARWARAQAAGLEVQVAVAAVAAPMLSEQLATWAANHLLEAVPLLQASSNPQEDEDGDQEAPFKETRGVERVREALHAHAWRGLRRHWPLPSPREPLQDPIIQYQGEASSDDDGEDEEGAVERAEAFVRALGSLAIARDLSQGDADDTLRRQRAEDVLVAFADALGIDLADC